MDWDKLRIFEAAADSGSFTRAGETLGLSQSAVSRQVSALEAGSRRAVVSSPRPRPHSHRTGRNAAGSGARRRAQTRRGASRLIDSRDKPQGELRVTTTLVLGSIWLSPRLGEFVELFPEVKLQLLLSDDELDLSMREADVALRLREPNQPDLIRRRLFTVHFHAYASADYLKKHGQPRDRGARPPSPCRLRRADGDAFPLRPQLAAHARARRQEPAHGASDHQQPRRDHPRRRARRRHRGAAGLLRRANSGLIRLLPQADMPEMDCFLVYAEEMKNVARVQAFRDFLVSKAQRWRF